MSTRSRIGIKKADGTIKSIYCHSDGYFEGVGKTLQENYKDPEKVNSLIELGDLSSLGDDLESTVSYHRDRNEELNFSEHPGQNSLLESAKKSWEEYAYIFEDGEWNFFKVR